VLNVSARSVEDNGPYQRIKTERFVLLWHCPDQLIRKELSRYTILFKVVDG